MQKLYLITGPAGVGRSTISKKIANSLEKSVCIEGDDIYHLVIGSYKSAWKDGNHLKFFWKNVFSLIENSVDYGYDVVFNYIINPNDIELIKDYFKDYPIYFAVLLTTEEELLQRDSNRPLEHQMKERSIILLNSFKKKNFDQRFIIDTTNLSIEEVTNNILNNQNFLL